MKKVFLFFIFCFGFLAGFSQPNLSDFNVPVVVPGQNDSRVTRRPLRRAEINSNSKNLIKYTKKIEKLNNAIETAKGTKVVRKARAEAIKLMTQTSIIASSELLAASQELYILADNKYNELNQGDNRAKAIAKSN